MYGGRTSPAGDYFLRFVPRMKKKKKFIASVSEERRGVFSAYE
jgi:hypothetical protein